jgi:hypothetical protein
LKVFYLIKNAGDIEDYIGLVARERNDFVVTILSLGSGKDNKVNKFRI